MMRIVTDLRAEWPRIRGYLEALLNKTDYEWIPEDVYMECRLGRAAVFISEDGCLVTKLIHDEMFDETTLFVWAAFSTHGDAIAHYQPEVVKIAQSANAAKIQFTSSRRGMDKLPDWQQGDTIYEMRV
jgi:hypothetical protein